ncbi:MAG: citrate/2-methylcitrate synthase, partial [Kiritimatiellia bacterium]|nr:citrate/2-methylcitrate synthase [Kiritimatiellia bacterium]
MADQKPDAAETAEFRFRDQTLKLPVRIGTEREVGVDISSLRTRTGAIAFDPGFANTGSCESAITFVDGEKGILRHRGYDIEDLAENCLFLEVAYLLVHGKLPNQKEMADFSHLMNRHSMIHEDMRTFFRQYPEGAHPMAVLSAMVVSLSSFYPEVETQEGLEPLNITVTRLLSKLRTISAFSYKKSVGQPFVYPSHKLTYCENFL